MTPEETLEAARNANIQDHHTPEDEAAIAAALTLLSTLLTPPDDERERGLAEALAAVEAKRSGDDNVHVQRFVAVSSANLRHLLSRLAALRARVAEVEGERQRWADIATERKIDLQNADALAHAVRCALGGGATGWVPGRGVDTLIDLALDIRAERDSLAAIRRYLEAAVQLGADASGREDVAAEWEAIPLDDRSRLEAWGNQVCNAGIEAGEDEAEELRDERDTLRRENERLRDLVRHQRGPLHDAGLLTDEEHAALAADSGAVARLEGYDILRRELEEVRGAAEAVVAAWTAAPERSMPGDTDITIARLQSVLRARATAALGGSDGRE